MCDSDVWRVFNVIANYRMAHRVLWVNEPHECEVGDDLGLLRL